MIEWTNSELVKIFFNKNLAIPGLFFFIFVFTIQFTHRYCRERMFGCF